MTARLHNTSLIDGKALAQSMRRELTDKILALKEKEAIIPGLAVVIVGDNPASQIYVRNKCKQTEEVGMKSFYHALPLSVTEQDLLDLVETLNHDNDVDGILVQLPLPDHIDAEKVIEAIDPAKDADGFHPINAGRLATGLTTESGSGGAKGLIPCTPLGCLKLLKSHLTDLSGLDALVIGRSNIVGKPVAQLLLQENCTVTIAHSRTKDLKTAVGRADIVIAAVGIAELVKGSWLKPGSVVIDVGMNRLQSADKGNGKSRLVGDVDFSSAQGIAGAVTPVPGGVGPMTIACLLENTYRAACQRRGILAT